ncbi:MAG: hypothetical protein AAFQ65_14295 [Myxococcota bacterium]
MVSERLSAKAIRIAAIASLVTAVTTFLLWYLAPTIPLETLEDRVALHTNTRYLARLWINFAHVFMALFAYAITAALLWSRRPVLSALSTVAFAFWALVEAIGVAVLIFTVNGAWRASYMDADPDARIRLATQINTFEGIWDGMFFVILVTFLIGTGALGAAMWSNDWIDRLMASLLLLAGPLTVIIIADGYFGASWSVWIAWMYPTLQPISRAVLAGWLWRKTLLDSPQSR